MVSCSLVSDEYTVRVVNGLFKWLEACNGLTLVNSRPLLGFMNLSPSLCCLCCKVGFKGFLLLGSVHSSWSGRFFSASILFVHRYTFYPTQFLYSIDLPS